jgi:hypothetical protein
MVDEYAVRLLVLIEDGKKNVADRQLRFEIHSDQPEKAFLVVDAGQVIAEIGE